MFEYKSSRVSLQEMYVVQIGINYPIHLGTAYKGDQTCGSNKSQFLQQQHSRRGARLW